jgi:hypothetical protein
MVLYICSRPSNQLSCIACWVFNEVTTTRAFLATPTVLPITFAATQVPCPGLKGLSCTEAGKIGPTGMELICLRGSS